MYEQLKIKRIEGREKMVKYNNKSSKIYNYGPV